MERIWDLPCEHGVGVHHLVNLGAYGGDCLGIVGVGEHTVDQAGDSLHELFVGTAGGDGCRAEAKTAGEEGAAAVVGYHVLVGGDVSLYEHTLRFLSAHVWGFGAEVYKHAVIVSSVGNDLVSAVDESVGKSVGVFLHLNGIFFPFGLESLSESNSLGGDHMLERTSLYSGEYS